MYKERTVAIANTRKISCGVISADVIDCKNDFFKMSFVLTLNSPFSKFISYYIFCINNILKTLFSEGLLFPDSYKYNPEEIHHTSLPEYDVRTA